MEDGQASCYVGSTHHQLEDVILSDMSEDDVLGIFGPLEDIVVAEIIATGATREELVAAHGWIARDESHSIADRVLPTGPMARVVRIIERVHIAKKNPVRSSPLGEDGSTLE
jgi:hypothetical protein